MPNASHLIERAAARLAASGAVPGQLSPMPSGAAPGGAPGIGADPLLNGTFLSASVSSHPMVPLELLEGAGLMTDQAGRSRISEELWLVQRQVLRTAFMPAGTLAPNAETARPYPNILMVTSARPSEGKSFTALNLAASIARQGDHAVLLVDTDVKEHSLTRLLGLQDATGLLDLAADGTLDPVRLDHPTEVDGLSVLPIGHVRGRGSDLLASRHVGRLLQGMARRQPERLVILDGAPCLATSDPAALAPLMGQILFVVEAERTQR
ncbi:MAG: P-loop NTPase, partial [Acetobacteraceae bacterium]